MPFSSQHAVQLDQALSNIAHARNLMDKAESCGVDCSARRQMADELETYLTAFKKNFMPPQPPRAS